MSAHLDALTGSGLESIQPAPHSETYVFPRLENRYQFTAYNRHRIDEHLCVAMKDLHPKFLNILDKTPTQ
jgi:hypothetical protein